MTYTIDPSDAVPSWPSPAMLAAEATVVFPWHLVVTIDGAWESNPVGVTDTEAASTSAMRAALRRHGPGAVGVVERALHHMSRPDYEYRATVHTATVDPTTGDIMTGPRTRWRTDAETLAHLRDALVALDTDDHR